MTRSRRRLLVPFVALCAAVLSGPVRSQEPDDPVNPAVKQPKGATAADGGKALDVLKKELADTQKKLATAEKTAADAATAAANAAKVADSLKNAVAAVTAEAAAAKKAAEEAKTTPPPATKGPDEETRKAIEEAVKAGTTGVGPAQNSADTAWMLTSSAFVLFMVPGLALFYAGMVRRKNVLATMMQSMAALAVVGVYWIAVGYGLAFGPSVDALKLSILGVENGGVIGWNPDLFFLRGVEASDTMPKLTIPVYVHVMFQGMFAIITPALISGAIAERIRFWPFCIFMILWITFVYCPLAHMVWAFDWFDPSVARDDRGGAAIGLLGKMGALDFAGGTVVHIAAGLAGLACCLVLRKRDGYPKVVAHPNSMVLTLLGAGLLWFGWFGFNGGSAGASNPLAGSAFAATQAAAAAAGLGWMLVEWLHKGKPTALGLASGIVAGLVAVTPASGFVYVWGGLAIGLAAAVVCYAAVLLKGVLGYDDSLDAFGVHGVGGFLGAVLTGVFCYTSVNSVGADGAIAYPAARVKWEERVREIEAKELPEARSAGDPRAADASRLEKEAAGLREKIDGGPLRQVVIQFKASVLSAVFAFAASLLLCALTQAVTRGNFSTSKKDETVGLDQTEHGEAGFDFGFASQNMTVAGAEPRAASAPKGNGRFGVTVEGATHGELMKVWTALCQPSEHPSDPDFLAVYPYVTTIRGSTFHCRGGSAPAIANRLESLFKKHLPGRPLKVATA